MARHREMTLYSFTQPACEPCWAVRGHPTPAARLRNPKLERCAYCGNSTRHGIYLRVDPRRVPFPTPMPDDPEPRDDAGTPGPQAA
jgi:hypothetical protein